MAATSKITRGARILPRIKATVASHLGLSTNEVVKQVTTVALTSANILAMNGAPVTVLAAPGTGKSIIIDSIIFKMVTTATAYANGGVVTFQYNGGTTATHAGSIAAAVVTAGAGTSYTQLGPTVAATGTTLIANKAIEVTNGTAAFITGTGTAVVHIVYRTVTLP